MGSCTIPNEVRFCLIQCCTKGGHIWWGPVPYQTESGSIGSYSIWQCSELYKAESVKSCNMLSQIQAVSLQIKLQVLIKTWSLTNREKTDFVDYTPEWKFRQFFSEPNLNKKNQFSSKLLSFSRPKNMDSEFRWFFLLPTVEAPWSIKLSCHHLIIFILRNCPLFLRDSVTRIKSHCKIDIL